MKVDPQQKHKETTYKVNLSLFKLSHTNFKETQKVVVPSPPSTFSIPKYLKTIDLKFSNNFEEIKELLKADLATNKEVTRTIYTDDINYHLQELINLKYEPKISIDNSKAISAIKFITAGDSESTITYSLLLVICLIILQIVFLLTSVNINVPCCRI